MKINTKQKYKIKPIFKNQVEFNLKFNWKYDINIKNKVNNLKQRAHHRIEASKMETKKSRLTKLAYLHYMVLSVMPNK